MKTPPITRGSPVAVLHYSPPPARPSALRGFISGQLAIVLAAILGGVCVLAYEWEHAHPGKHHSFSVLHHHK